MTSRSGYSAKVCLTLKVGGRDILLSHVGPNEVSVRELVNDLPPSNAELLIQVDDSRHSLEVYLPQGISSNSYEVAYV